MTVNFSTTVGSFCRLGGKKRSHVGASQDCVYQKLLKLVNFLTELFKKKYEGAFLTDSVVSKF